MTWKCFPHYWPFVGGIHRSHWIPLTKHQLGRPLMFLWCKMQQTVEQRVKLAVMWDTSMLIWHHSIVSKLRCFLSQKMHLLNIDISYTLIFSYIISNDWFLNDFMWLSTFLCYILCYLTVHRTQSSAQKLCLMWWLLTHWPLGEMGVILNVSLSHPGIPGVTLCFCTGSYAAVGAGRRFLFTR